MGIGDKNDQFKKRMPLLTVSLIWTVEIKLNWTDKSVSPSVLKLPLGNRTIYYQAMPGTLFRHYP